MDSQKITSDSQASLETVTYLASLVSDVREIDPILDKIRTITATMGPNRKLDAKNEATLKRVRAELEDYLLHRERLRSFTTEELQERIREHLTPSSVSSRPRRQLWTIWGIGLLTYLGMFAIPGSFSPSTRGQAGAFLFLFVIGIGTAMFFWTSLRSFKPELRVAYRYFCVAALIVGITQIQLPIIALFNFDHVNTPLVRYGGFMTPYTIVTCCLYLGIRKYAQVIGIRSKAMSLPLIIPGFILTGIIMAAIPNAHTFKPGHEFFFDLTVVSLSLQAYIGVFALWISYRVISSTTHLYATATKLLALTFALCLIGTIEYVASVFVFGELYGIRELVAAIPFILTAITLMYAAYSFKKTSRY